MQTNATLTLAFDVQKNQTIMRVHQQEPPLRVIRAFGMENSYKQLSAATPASDTNGKVSIGESSKEQLYEPAMNGHAPKKMAGAYADVALMESASEASSTPVAQPVLVHLQNVSGGLLGGDQLKLEATIGAKSQVQLTTTGSTRIYRSRNGYPATAQKTLISVEPGALLEYLPDTLIPYADSQYRQSTRIELSNDSGLFYWEVITPGREAKGECFHYELLQLDVDLLVNGLPIAIERNHLEPDRLRSTTLEPSGTGFGSATRLGPYRYFATFYICRVGIQEEEWLDLEKQLDEKARELSSPGHTLWGVSTLPAHGLCVRSVSTSCHSIQQGLPLFWQMAKEQLYQQNAVMPRKIY